MVEQPTPDTKDWTWVLERPCPECGFDTSAPDRAALAGLVAEVGERWSVALAESSAPRVRPAPTVWSPLEYGCHVRDVFGLVYHLVGGDRHVAEDVNQAMGLVEEDGGALVEPARGEDTPGDLDLDGAPRLTLGTTDTVILDDDWTVSSHDGSDASHWEHSIALHEKGIWVLTASDGGAAKLAPYGIVPVDPRQI